MGPGSIRKVELASTFIDATVASGFGTVSRHIATPCRSMTTGPALMCPTLVHSSITSSFWHCAFTAVGHRVETTPGILLLTLWMMCIGARITRVTLIHLSKCLAVDGRWPHPPCNRICGSPHCNNPSRLPPGKTSKPTKPLRPTASCWI